MKRFSNICCGSSGTKKEEEEEEESDQPSEPPSDSGSKLPSHLPGLPNSKIVRCLEQNNAFNIKKAQVTPNGSTHAIVISFDKQDNTTMTLEIDGWSCYRVNTRWNIRGNTWLIVDGLNVNFIWDTHGLFKKFMFRTRIDVGQRSRGGGGGGGCGGGGGGGGDECDDAGSVGEGSVCGDSSDPEFRGGQWEDPDKFYLLQIIGA